MNTTLLRTFAALVIVSVVAGCQSSAPPSTRSTADASCPAHGNTVCHTITIREK